MRRVMTVVVGLFASAAICACTPTASPSSWSVRNLDGLQVPEPLHWHTVWPAFASDDGVTAYLTNQPTPNAHCLGKRGQVCGFPVKRVRRGGVVVVVREVGYYSGDLVPKVAGLPTYRQAGPCQAGRWTPGAAGFVGVDVVKRRSGNRSNGEAVNFTAEFGPHSAEQRHLFAAMLTRTSH